VLAFNFAESHADPLQQAVSLHLVNAVVYLFHAEATAVANLARRHAVGQGVLQYRRDALAMFACKPIGALCRKVRCTWVVGSGVGE